MISVSVKPVYGDYEIHYTEQEYHDHLIETFIGVFERLLRNHVSTVMPLDVECEYYPDKRKFKIISHTKQYRVSVSRTMDMNPKFVRDYLV